MTIATGMQAALLLARGRADGLGLFTVPVEGPMRLAARSFWAIAAVLPGFVALHVMDWVLSGRAPAVGRHFAHAFAQDLVAFVVGWLAFAVLSHRLAEVSGRAALWPRYIAAWNWCNVLQYLMLVVAGLPALLGAPGWVVQTAWLVAIGWALWLEFFTTKLALSLSGGQAATLVALDFGLGIAIVAVMAGLN